MGKRFSVEVLLDLVDRFSGPLKSGPMKQLTALQKQTEITDRSMSRLGTGAGVVAAGLTLAAPLVLATAEAVRFESAMANVKKVVDFPTPRAFREMNRDILRLSLVTPLAATELAEITAAAGQAGIARGELLRFTRDAAKMGVAFDISAGEAGGAMTGLRTIFKLTQNEVVGLGDAYNYLSNNMDARAADIVNIANRAGATGRLFGLSGQQVGALGASFLALKTPPEVASTSINSLLNRLATAPQQTAAFQNGLARIGLEATDLKRRIGVDAQGALLDFLQRVRGSGDALGILTNLFGTEYADDIAKLVNSLDTYQGSLGLLGNQLGIAGSMQREYAARSATAANALILIRNAVKAFGVATTTFFLPVIQLASRLVTGFVGPILRLVDASPLLAGALAFIAAGLAALVTLIGLGIVTVAGLNLAMAQARIGLMLYAGTSEAAAGSQGLLNLALAGTRLRFIQAATGAKAFYASMLGAARLKLAALQAGGLSGALAVLRVGFMNAARASWAFTASLLTNPVFLLVAAIIALGASFVWAWRKSEDFRTGVMRGLEPIRRSWAGLKDDVAALGQTFAPLGAAFGRVMQRMGIDVSKIQRPLDALAYGFGYFIGFTGTAVAIVFGRTIAFLTTGFGGLVQIVDGLVTAGQGLVSLDFAKMREGLSQARGGIEQTLLAPLELGGIDSKQFRTDLNSGEGKAKSWRGLVWGWIATPFRAANAVFRPLSDSLNAARQKAEDWGLATRGRIGERFQTAGARTGALLDSLNGARPKIKTWRDDATSWLGTQFTTVAANVAPFLNSVSAASDESRPVWQSLLDKVTAPFDLPRANRRNFTPSLENAATKGTELWAAVRAQFPAFALPGLDRATNFASSLTSGETEGGDAWGRIQALFQSFALPGLNRRSSFVPSLAGAEAAGSDAWDNIKKLFPTFRLPWLKHDKFKESLNKAKGESKPIWEGITAFLIRPFSLPWAKHDKFKESLGKAEEKGKPIWERVTSLLKAAIPIPGVDWSAIEGSLGDVLKIIQDFGPQMLEAGKSLIGNLIEGFKSRIDELTGFLDNLKFPWQKDKAEGGSGGRGAQTATRANPTANLPTPPTYAPPVANRSATPAAMRPVVPQQAVPFDLRATLELGNVNPYSDYGKLLAQGFAKGILSEQQVAVYAVQRMGAATEAALKQKLQIRSPSRVFAGLGAFIPQGLGQGIMGQRSAVTKAMRTLAAAAVAVPITPALAMPEAPNFALGAPPALTRPAATNPNEQGGRTAQGAAAGQTVHKTYSFAGANFNLDMSEINGKEDFVGKLEQLFEWFGEDE